MGCLSMWVDESERPKIKPSGGLVVGGILVEDSKIPQIVAGWQLMKQAMGFSVSDEIKWFLEKRSGERLGLNKWEIRQQFIKFISSCENIQCIVAVMREQRRVALFKDKEFIMPSGYREEDKGKAQAVTQEKLEKPSPRDFYCEGLKYVIQRVAEECIERKASRCTIICDTPSLGKRKFFKGCLRGGPKALEKTYKREWYTSGVGVGPTGKYFDGPLKEIGFHPSILIGDATYDDMLQIADVVVGCIGSWVTSVSRGEELRPPLEESIKALSVRLRKGHGRGNDFFGDGFILHPPDFDLWLKLYESIGISLPTSRGDFKF